MTQILSVLTQEYVLLATDRRVTLTTGETRDDTTCKLISLCNTCGIAYSGIAALDGTPTHEWLARHLAEANCRGAGEASQVILDKAPSAFHKYAPEIRHHCFLLAGWARFEYLEGMRPHFCIATNALDNHGNRLAKANDVFDLRLRALRPDEPYMWVDAGIRLEPQRKKLFERSIASLVGRKVGAKSMLRLLVDEIVHTSQRPQSPVGRTILAMCIPKASVLQQERSGDRLAQARQPSSDDFTFAYFEPEYQELHQYGPTFVCDGTALTDFESETDPASDFQSAQVRILALPNRKTPHP